MFATRLLLASALMAGGCLGAFVPQPTTSQTAPTSGSAPSSNGGGSTPTAPANGTATPSGSDDAGIANAGAPPDLAGVVSDLAPSGGDMANGCIALTTPLTDGHHNAGQACLDCHGGGGGATTFSLGGTLYNAVTGGKAIAGATIIVVDAKGTKADIVTSQNGNFYTTQSLTPPFTVRASGCPNDARMTATAQGNCSTGGCHTSTLQVHLP